MATKRTGHENGVNFVAIWPAALQDPLKGLKFNLA
jgi:hypothetical protein